MDLFKFDKNSTILAEKYAPTNISEIIGAERQVALLVKWLKNYRLCAALNHKKNIDKKNGKKTGRRKTKATKKTKTDGEAEVEEVPEPVEDDENEDIQEIIEAAQNKKAKKKEPDVCSCAVITGDHGTGKTAVVKAVLNSLDFQIKVVNFAKIGTVKSIDDFIENMLTGEDIYETIENKKQKKTAIVVDETQTVSTPTEKSVINCLLNLNSELWACPVIFIGNNKHKKVMSSIKKECYHISMYPPDENDMATLLERIGIGERMELEDMTTIETIIRHSQNDYRRLIVTLGELQRLHTENDKCIITNKYLEDYIRCTEQKDMDRSIYENTNRLFTVYNGINDALKVFENDKSNMPLMMHQNHFLATNGYINDKTKLIDLSAEITENMAHGDVVDNYIYSDQNWDLRETQGFYTCVYPSFKLTHSIDTEKLLFDSQNPYYAPRFSSQYPKDLNRTSTQCINYKNVKSANEYLSNMAIDDYVMIVKLIKSLLEDGRVDECKELLKGYNLTQQGIMYILKIDKINGTRKDVSREVEKKVKEIAVEPVKAAIIKKGKQLKKIKQPKTKQNKPKVTQRVTPLTQRSKSLTPKVVSTPSTKKTKKSVKKAN